MGNRFSSVLLSSLMGAALCFVLVNVTFAAPTTPSDLGTTPATQEEVAPEIKAAFEDFKAAKFDDAVTKLETACKANPDLAPAQLLLAQWFSVLNPPQPQAVRQAIEVAVTKNPGDPEAYVILAELNLQNGNVTEAEVLYTYADSLNKSFTGSSKRKSEIQKRILLGLAQVFAARGRSADAITNLTAVLQLEPANIGALDLAGRIYFNDNKTEEALDMFRKIKAVEPKALQPEARIALMFQSRGKAEDIKQANAYMAAALKAAPKDLQVYLAIASWSIQVNKIDQAEKFADNAISLDATSLEAAMLRGVVALYKKDFAKAEACFQKVLSESPSNFAASNNLALALCELGDADKLKKAEEYALVNIRQFQKQPEAFSTAAWILFKKGEYQNAAQLIQQSIQLSNGQMSQDTAFYLAAILQKLGGENNLKQAKEILTKLLDTTDANKAPFTMKPEAEKLNAEMK